MKKKYWKKNFEKKMLKTKILKKKCWKKVLTKTILEKSFDKKNVGKIDSKTKIFITKNYSNIDKCHTIFAVLAPFEKTGRKTGSNENVETQGMWRFE